MRERERERERERIDYWLLRLKIGRQVVAEDQVETLENNKQTSVEVYRFRSDLDLVVYIDFLLQQWVPRVLVRVFWGTDPYKIWVIKNVIFASNWCEFGEGYYFILFFDDFFWADLLLLLFGKVFVSTQDFGGVKFYF